MPSIVKSTSAPSLISNEKTLESRDHSAASRFAPREDVFVRQEPSLGATKTAKKTQVGEVDVEKMILSKGEKWNDAQTRNALLQAGLYERLVEAMRAVPAIQQQGAREALAESAIQFFEAHDGLKPDLDNSFLQKNIELFWVLFGDKDKELYETGVLGALELDPPEPYESRVRSALIIAESFAIFKSMDANCKFE